MNCDVGGGVHTLQEAMMSDALIDLVLSVPARTSRSAEAADARAKAGAGHQSPRERILKALELAARARALTPGSRMDR